MKMVTRKLHLYGREWEFDIRSGKSFRSASASMQPTLILLGGIIIDGLIFILFLLLANSNKKATEFARQVTEKLQVKARELEASNMELEKFAYVASHDLKTPLRGMGDLREYLEEDLELYLQNPEANPDVKKNLIRIDQQISRMNNLIDGILKYSSIDSEATNLKKINLAQTVTDIGLDLGLDSTKFRVEGSPQSFLTEIVRFDQVLTNLIGNAVKYHHDLDSAKIKVSIKKENEFYKVSVADNGPGIHPRFHSRIFEVFQTLQPKDDGESTGIGLAIVKKMVESQSGTIKVDSDVGQGACFTFSWPVIQKKSQ